MAGLIQSTRFRICGMVCTATLSVSFPSKICIDEIEIYASPIVVPEPGGAVLMVFGAIVALVRRRRKSC